MVDPIEPPDGTPIGPIEYECKGCFDPATGQLWRYTKGPGAIIGTDVYVRGQVPRMIMSTPDQNGVSSPFKVWQPGFVLDPNARPIVR